MNYTIKVDSTKELIVYTHCGLASRKSVGEAWLEILNLPEIKDDKYNIFTDYRNCKFDFGWSDSDVIMDFLSKYKKILSEKKQAIVLDNQVSTAISMLFQSPLHETINFKIRVFSTIEAAMLWLETD